MYFVYMLTNKHNTTFIPELPTTWKDVCMNIKINWLTAFQSNIIFISWFILKIPMMSGLQLLGKSK